MREHPRTGPYVEDLAKVACSSSEEVQMLLAHGNTIRTVGATQLNVESSRSHAIVTLAAAGGDFAEGVLTLVDCAGKRAERRRATSYKLQVATLKSLEEGRCKLQAASGAPTRAGRPSSRDTTCRSAPRPRRRVEC